jgi:hypothetical protein
MTIERLPWGAVWRNVLVKQGDDASLPEGTGPERFNV